MSIRNPGTVVSVRGSVVEVRFAGPLSPGSSVLRAGEAGRIVIEVLAQWNKRHVRVIVPRPPDAKGTGFRCDES